MIIRPPLIAGRSRCSSDNPATGRIDNRGPATSMIPGETTNSTCRSSNAQANRRNACPDRSGWETTATT